MRRVNRRTDRRILKIFLPGFRIQSEILTDFRIHPFFWAKILDNLVPRVLSYPSLRSERERERERDPGWVWSRGSSANLLIPREEPFVSQFFCLVRFHRSHNDRKSKIDLLSLQLWLEFGKFLPKHYYHQINKRISRRGIKNSCCRSLTDDTNH